MQITPMERLLYQVLIFEGSLKWVGIDSLESKESGYVIVGYFTISCTLIQALKASAGVSS